MSALLERENLPTDKAAQTDETVPECLRAYRPFVLLWSDTQKVDHKASWGFSGGSRGMSVTELDCTSHDHFYTTNDGDGVTFIDCSNGI